MDKILRAISTNGYIKVTVIDSKETVAKAQSVHGLKTAASAALGRALTAALIICNDMKNETDRVSIQIRSEGEIGNIITEANGKNEVKGYVTNPDVVMPKRADGKIDVGGALGHKGTLTIIKDIGLKEPYSGTVELISGEIAEDIANYYMQSEQIPTVLGLGVLVAENQMILSSGGYMVQLLPDAPDDVIDIIEKNVAALPESISAHFAAGKSPEVLLKLLLSGFEYEILSEKECGFVCDCKRYRVEQALLSMGVAELETLRDEDKKIDVTCHFCNKEYNFLEEDIQVLINVANRLKS